jgi:hypothetical protein
MAGNNWRRTERLMNSKTTMMKLAALEPLPISEMERGNELQVVTGK